jgi:hypothetical protein
MRRITTGVRRLRCLQGRCCRWAPTPRGWTMGLHPRLTGLSNILQRGPTGARAAHRLSELEPLALRSQRHLGYGESAELHQFGWLGRYLDTLPRPLDALAAWNTTGETPRALLSASQAYRRFRTRARTRSEPEPRSGCAAGAGGGTDNGGQPRLRPSASGLPE